MFLELIATVVMGAGVAGIALIFVKVSRGRLPRWIVPAGAGFAMIAFSIWSEYSWFSRTAGDLPEPVVVAWTNSESAPWKPWTYAMPQTTRFVAVDTASIRTNDAQPGQRVVDLYFMGRWAPSQAMRVLLDCQGARRVDLASSADPGNAASGERQAWVQMDPSDPVLTTACDAEVG
jgi:hypothetical protein